MSALSWPFVLILHEAGVRNYLVFLMKETLKINKASPLSAENTQYSCYSDALVMQQAYDCALIIHSLCSFIVSLILRTGIVTDKEKVFKKNREKFREHLPLFSR